jgi:hypothetical protein
MSGIQERPADVRGGPPTSRFQRKAGGRPAYAAAPRSLMEPPIAGHDNRMWRNEGEQLGSNLNLTDQH